MTLEQPETNKEPVHASSHTLVGEVMDHIKNNWNTVTDSDARIGARATAGLTLAAEGLAVAGATYATARLGLSKLAVGAEQKSSLLVKTDQDLWPLLSSIGPNRTIESILARKSIAREFTSSAADRAAAHEFTEALAKQDMPGIGNFVARFDGKPAHLGDLLRVMQEDMKQTGLANKFSIGLGYNSERGTFSILKRNDKNGYSPYAYFRTDRSDPTTPLSEARKLAASVQKLELQSKVAGS